MCSHVHISMQGRVCCSIFIDVPQLDTHSVYQSSHSPSSNLFNQKIPNALFPLWSPWSPVTAAGLLPSLCGLVWAHWWRCLSGYAFRGNICHPPQRLNIQCVVKPWSRFVNCQACCVNISWWFEIHNGWVYMQTDEFSLPHTSDRLTCTSSSTWQLTNPTKTTFHLCFGQSLLQLNINLTMANVCLLSFDSIYMQLLRYPSQNQME